MTTFGARRAQSVWQRRILPTTRLGRVACWLALAFVLGFVLNQVLVGLIGQGTAVEGLTRLALIAWGWLLFACGFAAGAVAFVAVVRQRERSVLAFLCMLPGLFVVVFVLGEFLFPH